VDILIDNKKISNISFDETGMNSFGYENINEVFFDIFEIKSKEFDLVKEKKGEFNGSPIIEMDLTVDNQIFKNVKFVLKEQSKISVNPNLLDYTTAIIKEKVSKKPKNKKSTKTTKPTKTSKAKKIIKEDVLPDLKETQEEYKKISGLESIEKNKNEFLSSLKSELLENIKQEIQMGVISEMMQSHIKSNFSDLLDENKNNGKLGKIFESYNTSFRNDIIQLSEKLAKRESLRYAESGGGSNATQYANGGTINGNLIINGTLSASHISSPDVIGSSGGSSTNKKVFNIVGDGINQQFILNHDFNTYDVMVTVYEKFTKAVVLCYVEHTTLNTVTIDVGSIIPNGQDLYTAVIIS